MNTAVRTCRWAALGVAGVLATIATPGWSASAEDDEAAIEEIVVTGSYIRRTTESSPSPLTVVDRVQLEQYGTIEPSDIVNRMTFNSGSTNVTNAFSGGDNNTGQTNVNLRNLGLGSTLVLLDGKRSVPGSSDANANTFVSLSTLVPSIAIERFEVVKDGASSLYGSDAIAGVVNIITRDDFEGIELMLDYRADQETGDQDDNTIAAIWGVQGDRGGIVVSAEYLDRDGLQIADRFEDFGRSGVSTLGQPGTSIVGAAPGVDPNIARAVSSGHLVGGGVATGLGGAIAGDLDCEAASALNSQSFRSPLTGIVSPAEDALSALGGCIYDFSPFFNIVGEEERFLLHANANWAIDDQHELYGSFRFSDQQFERGNSLFPLVRFPVIPRGNPGLENDLARRQAALDAIPEDTILAGPDDDFPGVVTAGDIDLLSQVGGAQFFGRVLGGGPDSPFALRPVDTDTREFTDEFRVVTGLRGDLMFGNWTYDASYTFSQRDNQGRNTDTRQQQLIQALNGLGGPNCDPVNGEPGSGNLGTGGCFYWNPFGSSLVTPDGSLQDDPMLTNPPELLDWMVGEIRNFTEFEQKVADVVVTGDLVELPFSELPLAMAAGLQWRQDQVTSDLDQDSNVNNFSFIFGAQDFQGEENTFAGFLELSIPVGETLEIQASGRYEYFEELSDDTWDPKITGLWTPRDDITFRASWGTSFRIGSLLQRFGQTTQLLNIADQEFSGTSLAFRPIITSGNPDLTPEDATAYNFGFSYRPTEGPLANLRVDLDYYNYEIEDLITRQGFDELIDLDIAARCPQGLNADPTDNIPDCGLQPDGDVVTVNPGIPEVVRAGPEDDFSLLRIENSFNNSQELESDGLDLTVGYTWFTDRFGSFSPEITGSWTNSWDLTNPQGLKIDGVGQRNFGNSIGRTLPEWKVNFSFAWNRGRHSAFVLGRFIDGFTDDQPAPSLLRATTFGVDVDDRDIASMTTWDLQYRVELPAIGPLAEGSTLSLGGINIFNRKPPKVNVDGGFDPTAHDPRGAMWYGRLTFQL